MEKELVGLAFKSDTGPGTSNSSCVVICETHMCTLRNFIWESGGCTHSERLRGLSDAVLVMRDHTELVGTAGLQPLHVQFLERPGSGVQNAFPEMM